MCVVCVWCVRERERLCGVCERERVCVCVRERERGERACGMVCERERERVCVRECVWCVCGEERVCVWCGVCVCVCGV